MDLKIFSGYQKWKLVTTVRIIDPDDRDRNHS
jgi:hypothetical protein